MREKPETTIKAVTASVEVHAHREKAARTGQGRRSPV
jgi:hypothetical protein